MTDDTTTTTETTDAAPVIADNASDIPAAGEAPAPAPSTALATSSGTPPNGVSVIVPPTRPPQPQLDGQGIVPFEPRDTQEMFRYANFLAKSELVAKPLRGRPHDVLLVLLKGHQLGLHPMTSISAIDVIEGKAQISAQLMVGIIRRSGMCKYWMLVESTTEIATYETLRIGDPLPTRMSYTIADADAAGLSNKDNWKKMKKIMLRRRCQSTLGREVYPEIVLGLYDEDELTEMRESGIADPDFRETAEQAAAHQRTIGVIDIVGTSHTRPASSGDPLKDRLRERAAGRADAAPVDMAFLCPDCGIPITRKGRCDACERSR